jgi:hypothetical protein
MTSQLKALPSEYAGCVFRSRLEARVAYYFDLLSIRWEYEPEGFELPSGNYAPDFLCDRNFYVEVKPDTSAFPSYEERLRQLCQLSKKDVYYMPGIPFQDLESLSVFRRGGDSWLSNPAHYFSFDEGQDEWGREHRGASVFTRNTRRGPDAYFTWYAFCAKKWGYPYYGDEYWLQCDEDVETIHRARFLKFDQSGRAML